jgi:hypothetical protein
LDRRPELLRLDHGSPVDLSLARGLNGHGVIVALLLVEGYDHQHGSGRDHHDCEDVHQPSQPMAVSWPP